MTQGQRSKVAPLHSSEEVSSFLFKLDSEAFNERFERNGAFRPLLRSSRVGVGVGGFCWAASDSTPEELIGGSSMGTQNSRIEHEHQLKKKKKAARRFELAPSRVASLLRSRFRPFRVRVPRGIFCLVFIFSFAWVVGSDPLWCNYCLCGWACACPARSRCSTRTTRLADA